MTHGPKEKDTVSALHFFKKPFTTLQSPIYASHFRSFFTDTSFLYYKSWCAIVISNKKIKKKKGISLSIYVIITYGWRKCSKSQARRMETARSGNPLWGLQALCWIIPSCCSALCCRRWWSTYLSLEPSTLAPKQSSSPNVLLVALICEEIASLRHRNCFEMVFKARAVYDLAAPKPAACSNDDITICIWWWYCRYLCSTFKSKTKHPSIGISYHNIICRVENLLYVLKVCVCVYIYIVILVLFTTQHIIYYNVVKVKNNNNLLVYWVMDKKLILIYY